MLRKLGNLKRIRSERSLTVQGLSKASGVPRSTIVGLVEGTRKAQQVTIDKLAKALGVEPGELALRYTAPYQKSSPQDCPRTPGPFQHSDHPRHLFSRATEHAGSGRSSDGRGVVLARWRRN